MNGEFVIVRCKSAGVHMGFLIEFSGQCVQLRESRRLWKWEEAFTLNEVSVQGCGEGSRISEAVDKIFLLDAIEVIPCTEKAKKNLRRTRNN